MKLSHRTEWGSSAPPLYVEKEKRLASGEEYYDLACTTPTSVGLRLPIEQIAEAISQSDLWREYHPDPSGDRQARIALSRFYSEWGEKTSPDRIVLASSTSEIYSWLFQVLCNPGETVLIPTPGYPLFEEIAALSSVKTEKAPIERYGGRWIFPVASWTLPAKCRALIVVSPHNPTGAEPTEAEWGEIFSFCRKNRLVLIVDEVFRLSHKHGSKSVVEWDQAQTPVVVLSGLSKWLAAPQLKLSWARLYGRDDDLHQFISALEIAADACLNLSGPVQAALPQLLSLIEISSTEVLKRLETNRATLRRLLEKNTVLKQVDEEKSWYAVLSFPHGDEEEITLALIREEGLFCHPGYFYDFESQESALSILVLGLMAPPALFEKGLLKLIAFFEKRLDCGSIFPLQR